MPSEWKAMCRARAFRVDGNGVVVAFENGRSHRVAVVELEGEFLLRAVVVGTAIVREGGEHLVIRAWLRNRAVSLVGFHVDEKGRLVCEANVPKDGLTAEEFQFCLRHVAIESDRFEYVLTGKDAE